MLAPKEKITVALEQLRALQVGGIVEDRRLSRSHRKLLLNSGFLVEIVKGWSYVNVPDVKAADSVWPQAYWEFVRQYLDVNFKDDNCLSAEASLVLQAGSWSTPNRLSVLTYRGRVTPLNLPSGYSVMIVQDYVTYPKELVNYNGFSLMPISEALARIPKEFYTRYPQEAAIIINQVTDMSPVLTALLMHGVADTAGQLAGAFRALNRPQRADEIIATMQRMGYKLREVNPFETSIDEMRPIQDVTLYEATLRSMMDEVRATLKKNVGSGKERPTVQAV